MPTLKNCPEGLTRLPALAGTNAFFGPITPDIDFSIPPGHVCPTWISRDPMDDSCDAKTPEPYLETLDDGSGWCPVCVRCLAEFQPGVSPEFGGMTVRGENVEKFCQTCLDGIVKMY